MRTSKLKPTGQYQSAATMQTPKLRFDPSQYNPNTGYPAVGSGMFWQQ